MNNIKILYHNRIDASKVINFYKTNEWKDWDIFHYWCFLNKRLKFQQNVCNGCHGSSMMSMNLSDIAILNIKNANYFCIINGIRKCKAINVMQHMDLTKKRNITKDKCY